MNEKCKNYLLNSRKIAEECFKSSFKEYAEIDIDSVLNGDEILKTHFETNEKLKDEIKLYSSYVFLWNYVGKLNSNGIELNIRHSMVDIMDDLENELLENFSLDKAKLSKFIKNTRTKLIKYIHRSDAVSLNIEELKSLHKELLMTKLPSRDENIKFSMSDDDFYKIINPTPKLSGKENLDSKDDIIEEIFSDIELGYSSGCTALSSNSNNPEFFNSPLSPILTPRKSEKSLMSRSESSYKDLGTGFNLLL